MKRGEILTKKSYKNYEKDKGAIAAKGIPPKAYEKAIRRIAKKNGI